MRGKTHVAITLMFMYALNPVPDINIKTVLFVFGGIIGSYLPDCDHKHAPAGKIIPLWAIIKHRTYTHSLSGALLSFIIFCFINIYLGKGVCIGYLLHLLFDSMTYTGLNYVFFPIIVFKNNRR